MAGIAISMMRTADATSDGIVLPIAWNMLDVTKITPDAMKFHEMILMYSVPSVMTAASFEKSRIIASGAMWQMIPKASIAAAARIAASLNVAFTRDARRAPKF